MNFAFMTGGTVADAILITVDPPVSPSPSVGNTIPTASQRRLIPNSLGVCGLRATLAKMLIKRRSIQASVLMVQPRIQPVQI